MARSDGARSELAQRLGALLTQVAALLESVAPGADDASSLVAACRGYLAMLAGPPAVLAAEPQALPVRRWLVDARRTPPSGDRAEASPADRLLEALAGAEPLLAWRRNPNYRAETVGPRFLEGYGYLEVVGPLGPVVDHGLRLGVLVLGPGLLYPVHHHPAEEVYVPLAGRAAWWDEGSGWRRVPPLGVVHHPSGARHATYTGAEALLALYVWRGDIAVEARLAVSA